MHTRITPRPDYGPTIQTPNGIGGSNRPLLRAPFGTVWTDEDLQPFLTDDYETDQQPMATQILLDLAAALAMARALWLGAESRQPANARGYGEDSYRETQVIHEPVFNPRSSRR